MSSLDTDPSLRHGTQNTAWGFVGTQQENTGLTPRPALLLAVYACFAKTARSRFLMSGTTKKRRIDGLVEAIDEAKAELEEREKALEQREEQLKKALEGVDHEKRLMAGRTPSDVLQLNIGGTKIAVSRKTLCQYEPSLLAAKFSGRWDDSVEKDAEGSFFIDQPCEVPAVTFRTTDTSSGSPEPHSRLPPWQLFLPLINYLRAKAIETPESLVPAPKVGEEDAFKRVVEYYGMTPFLYQQSFSLYRGLSGQANIIGGLEPSVSCTTWSTFILSPRNNHDRRVVSFSVALDSVERPQIGWSSSTSSSFPSRVGNNETKGVGDEQASVALDGLRGGVCMNGQVQTAVSGLTLQAGSVVTCELSNGPWRWLVDGQEVAAVHPSAFASLGQYQSGAVHYQVVNQQPRPTISGKGQWRITQYVYAP